MKKEFLLAGSAFFFLAVFSSCFRSHEISVYESDSEDEYRIKINYKKDQTHTVRLFLDEHLKNHIVSFKNAAVDREIILDDNTEVYINSRPGRLRIKIDKTENSEESCERIKVVCEEIKAILEENDF